MKVVIVEDGRFETYPHDGDWQGMDTSRDLQPLTEAGARPWPPWPGWGDDR